MKAVTYFDLTEINDTMKGKFITLEVSNMTSSDPSVNEDFGKMPTEGTLRIRIPDDCPAAKLFGSLAKQYKVTIEPSEY